MRTNSGMQYEFADTKNPKILSLDIFFKNL